MASHGSLDRFDPLDDQIHKRPEHEKRAAHPERPAEWATCKTRRDVENPSAPHHQDDHDESRRDEGFPLTHEILCLDDDVGGRAGLAAQDDASGLVLRLERVLHVHLDLA